MSMKTLRMSSSRRFAVVAAVVVATASMVLTFLTPSQAQAVTYSQLLTARSQAAASKKRVADLKSQLSGVSSSLQKQILELDDLTNNQIPAAQEAVTSANSASAAADDAASAAAERLAAAQKDKADLQEKIKQTGEDYDDAHAAVAEVARTSLHGSQASDTMSIVVGSKDAGDYVDSMQTSAAISRSEAETADSAAQDLSTSKNREQRLEAIETEISSLKAQADQEAAVAASAAADAQAKSAQLESLRNEGDTKRAALESKESQLKTSAAKEAAENLVIQSQVDSYNKQYAAQQAAAAKKAAALAAQSQGSTKKTSSSSSSSSSSHTSSSSSSSNKGSSSSSSSSGWSHPSYDTGNAYPRYQCTWWVYIRRHQLGLPVASYFGNGGQWDNTARSMGYKVDHTPSVGAVMVFEPGQYGMSAQYGHVAIVEKVNSDGSVTTSETGAVMQGRIYSRRIYGTSAFSFIHS